MSKKSILQGILATLARAVIARYKPTIIGVTGSVGKTSTRLAIASILQQKFQIRTAEKNYNNEIGLPLTILGIAHYGHNVFWWIAAIVKTTFQLLIQKQPYPEILILEYGIDRPGDMDYLLSIARPTIGVVTAIGETPVHVEFFHDISDLVTEKEKLVKAIPANGTAILDRDDRMVFGMKEKIGATIYTYGFHKMADFRMVFCKPKIVEHSQGVAAPKGIQCKLEYKGNIVPFVLTETIGIPHAIGAIAGIAVAHALGMNLVEAGEALARFVPPPGRLRLIEGIRNSLVIDDTYNAAPESMHAALDTLELLPGKRKIAVLGDMLELGRFTKDAHESIGKRAAEFVDLLFVVGLHARSIATGATHPDINKKKPMQFDHVFQCHDAHEAAKMVKRMVHGGDLILVKGSQGMRMERVVEQIMAHPDDAERLLVRQDALWKRK